MIVIPTKQLAEELELSNASLNYHMKILHRNKLVDITKSVAEEHGIIQKFFSSAAYLFVYDLDSMPKDIARYFYPVGLERARALVSALMIETGSSTSAKKTLSHSDIDDISASLSRLLVSVARQYGRERASYGDESIVYEIYTRVFNLFLKHQELPAGTRSS